MRSVMYPGYSVFEFCGIQSQRP